MHIDKLITVKEIIRKSFLLLCAGSVLVGNLTGCQPAFQYPGADTFTLEAAVKNTSISENDPIEIDCKLRNQSQKDYNISHSSEVITYQFEDKEEVVHAIEVEKQFQKNNTISRQITLDPLPAGAYQIIIKAKFYLKPTKSASESREYTYNKTLRFHVVD